MKFILVFILAWVSGFSQSSDQVLVFSKTEGYRHKAIEIGVQTLESLGVDHNFSVTHTEYSEVFNAEDLQRYKLVIFLNTTGDVLNVKQQEHFKKYINNGGSFLGVHAASDTEFNWPWYGKLVGAYFLDHPKACEAKLKVVDASHVSTKHLPSTWSHFDEWYNFKTISPNIHPVLLLDETSYSGGKNKDYHPIAWYQEFDGGRSFYTGLGHTKEAYTDPKFINHLLGGIAYCLNR
ncbi:ThuA domain-containing protein [Formosa sediminum]|uniref:ThuA domain-containing protein n=1 Tax=Formosa sediminum TaxID=2594004 RepID=A0A516GNH8_9FLAO|nr:ThuA domain-containing protein [Formosa sediminum]QDO93077.1 ThuA domain-containing protein [Formosa sediminum]